MIAKSRLLAWLLALVAVPALADTARLATPYPSATTPKAIDRGALELLSGETTMSVTVALRLTDPDGAEALLKSVSTPGSAQYRQFLSRDQFAARFAPGSAEVAKVIAGLARYGLSATQATATTLTVSGRPAEMESAFGVSLHSYEVAAHGSAPAYSYHAPVGAAMIPAELAGKVAAVVGLDNRPSLRPHSFKSPLKTAPATMLPSPQTTHPFGSLTVADFVSLYDVGPLYQHHVSGSGRTIGIMSLANFTPSDAYAYWSALGLNVNPNRISVVYVDGGPGAPSDASGSLETTLDNEQSGGIAPDANIIDYLAPNTNQAFVDVFAAAIDANKADSLSISWGTWEWFDNLDNSPVIDPYSGQTVSTTQAVHELLLQAGIQGQSVYAAAGDGGAYDANDSLGCYGPYSSSDPSSCSLVLSVDYPASDTAITAAGGTTLPGHQSYCLNAACKPPHYNITIPHQQVWGWDYLEGLCQALGLSESACGIFPGGGGGGVSITFPLPSYQQNENGIQSSQPNQVFEAGSTYTGGDGTLYYALPAYYPGRNVPDVSFNADPETGYVIYYTSNVSGFALNTFYGGTSFVGPQLNGVTVLFDQYLGGRVGLLNPALYAAPNGPNAEGGGGAPLSAIAYGDNWFYQGSHGYNPAAGLGVMDVASFAQYLREQGQP
jgi:kumamolisin